MNLLTQCIEASDGALKAIADTCGVTYQAVRKWESAGRLPQSEHTGATHYAKNIAALPADVVGKGVTQQRLLDWSAKGWSQAA